ncbi:WXG100 family type VII secretion target, partial [Mycobacterium kansasii]
NHVHPAPDHNRARPQAQVLPTRPQKIGEEVSTLPKGTRSDGIAQRVTSLHLNQDQAAVAADIAAKTAFGETAGIANLPNGTKVVLPVRIDQGIALIVQPDGSVAVFRGDLHQFLPYLGK